MPEDKTYSDVFEYEEAQRTPVMTTKDQCPACTNMLCQCRKCRKVNTGFDDVCQGCEFDENEPCPGYKSPEPMKSE